MSMIKMFGSGPKKQKVSIRNLIKLRLCSLIFFSNIKKVSTGGNRNTFQAGGRSMKLRRKEMKMPEQSTQHRYF